MKIFSFFILIICFLSCSDIKESYFKHDSINTTFYVTNVYKAKYSKVYGYIIYNNIKIPIDNRLKGYYYKDYNLNVGDKFETVIDVYYYPTKNGYEIRFGDVDVSKYVKNKN